MDRDERSRGASGVLRDGVRELVDRRGAGRVDGGDDAAELVGPDVGVLLRQGRRQLGEGDGVAGRVLVQPQLVDRLELGADAQGLDVDEPGPGVEDQLGCEVTRQGESRFRVAGESDGAELFEVHQCE